MCGGMLARGRCRRPLRSFLAGRRAAELESREGDPKVLPKGTNVDVKGEVTLPDGTVRIHILHYEKRGAQNKRIPTCVRQMRGGA